MSCKEVLTIEQARERFIASLHLTVSQTVCEPSFITWLQETLTPDCQGDCKIIIHYQRTDAHISAALGQQWQVTLSDRLLTALATRLGQENVQLCT